MFVEKKPKKGDIIEKYYEREGYYRWVRRSREVNGGWW